METVDMNEEPCPVTGCSVTGPMFERDVVIAQQVRTPNGNVIPFTLDFLVIVHVCWVHAREIDKLVPESWTPEVVE